jgi:hypothetical protein
VANGGVKAIKAGDRRLIFVDSLKAYVASLPAATFRP